MHFLFRWRALHVCAALTLLLCFSVSHWNSHSLRTLTTKALSGAVIKKNNDGNDPVLTYKYDNQHTGANTNEVLLNPNNVNKKSFAQLKSYPVDAQIYAQPLYMPNVAVKGTTKNLVIVATENNSVYAFDADLKGSN